MINLVLYLQGLFMLLCVDEKNVDKFHILGYVIVNTLSCIFGRYAADAVISPFVKGQPDSIKSVQKKIHSTVSAAEGNSSFFRLQKSKFEQANGEQKQILNDYSK